MNLPGWFQQAWPFGNQRQALLAEYGRLKQLRLVLADIGLRGGLWDHSPPVKNLFEAGRAAGRRDMAVEIFRIVNTDPAQLFQLAPAKPQEQKRGGG